MKVRLRDLWTGMHAPAFEGGCSQLEPWSVWLLEFQGAGGSRQWRAHGRLLKAPWSRVGGGWAHRPGPSSPEAREWLQRRGLIGGQTVWFPMGSLLKPDQASVADLREWRQQPTTWTPKVWHDSLASARESGQRMADVLCPRSQTHREFAPH